jgi:hypothetical protein
MSDDRLTIEQHDRLASILDYISVPRPELEWGGTRRESRRINSSEWKYKITMELYYLYRDLHPDDGEFTLECMTDFFDDSYVTELTSIKERFKRLITCCTVR